MTTLKEIKAAYPDHKVEQEGSKQLFYVCTAYGWVALSYETIVAAHFKGLTRVTTEKYSPTTSGHCNLISRDAAKVVRVSVEELQLTVTAILGK